MKHRYYWLTGVIMLFVLIWITVARSYHSIASLTANWLTAIWLIWFLWYSYIVNETLLENKLIMEDKLLSYPWYRLTLAGIWTIICMIRLDTPITKLTGTFAVTSICLWRDHRWAAFLALDMLWIIIISLIIKQQWLADLYAIYLYYFLVIAILTMIINTKKSSEEE
jgi:hypothetical protein